MPRVSKKELAFIPVTLELVFETKKDLDNWIAFFGGDWDDEDDCLDAACELDPHDDVLEALKNLAGEEVE